MTKLDQPTENARRVYVAMTRLFVRYRDDRLRLANVAVCKEAGIAVDDLASAQSLLVSAGLLAIRCCTAKCTYIRPDSTHRKEADHER